MEEHLENEKFYVPQIEEFFVGFEFEYMNMYYTNWLRTSWGTALNMSNLQNDIIAGHIRVKRLDKQDLEELGFLSTEKEYVFKHKQWIIRIVNWCHVNGAAMYLTEYLDAANINIVFKGFARNKSELSKILKLVGHGR